MASKRVPKFRSLRNALLASAAALACLTAAHTSAFQASPAQTQSPAGQATGDAMMDNFGLTSQNKAQTDGAAKRAAAAPVVSLRGDTTYLMSAFPATSQDRLSLFSSYDGVTFTSLANETYQPPADLLRDPSIIRQPDGTYYIAYTTNWNGQTFGIARSTDLKTWQHVTDVTVPLAGLTNVWAPEWFRDADGSVHIVVSLSTGGTKGPFAAYALTATDASLARFGAPVRMEGLQDNHIDTFVVQTGGKYSAFTKNETTKDIELATADRLTGPWTITRKGDWAGWGSWIEGPAVVKLKSGAWRIYFDDYLAKHYWYSDSTDGFKTWTPRQEVGGVSGAVRHFTVISEPTTEVEAATAPKARGKAITWDKHSLMIDGERVMIWAGEFHPFRLPSPSLWPDILQKMKATGYNTVNLYVDWGYHTSRPGQFDFSGIRDMERALEMAEAEGLYVIIRPGPYVNAELTRGGFPGYLARQKAIARTDDPEYLKDVDDWMTQFNAIVARHQITNGGGTIIAYQIENELSQTSDTHKRYMQHLADKAKADGITVPLFHNSASRLPNWTPPSSTASFALPGPVDLYAFDGYPGGGCTNTHDVGKPNKVPNWGLYGEVPPNAVRDENNLIKVGALASPNTPGFVAEIGGGWFDFWGSVGTYACTAKRTGPNYERAFYGSSIINGLSLHSVYMAFGGTSWGWLPASVVYTSYDYGSPISEARVLRDKSYTMKQLGQFVQAATPMLASMDKGLPLAASSPAIKLYHNTSPKHGDLIFAIHEPSDATSDDTFTFDYNGYRIPQAGILRLKGQDAKLLVADYPLERQRVVYTTSDLQTHAKQGPRDIALFYGRKGTDGETVLRYTKRPVVEVLSGTTASVYDKKTGDLRLNYTHDGLIQVRITAPGQAPLLLLLADDATAQEFWRQDTTEGAIIERSRALIRNATYTDTGLHLTGDTTEASTIEIWPAVSEPAITFNGTVLTLTPTKSGGWISAPVPGPDAVTLPDLMALTWQRRQGSPEAALAFDDTKWRKADLTTSAATTATQPPAGQPVLSMSDYGFHHGDVWYRGSFTTTKKDQPDKLDVRFNGGPAGVMQVWIDGQFVGESEGASGEARPKTTQDAHFALSKALLKPGEHVISVMVRNMSHNWDLGADDEHKEARGLISVSLSTDSAQPFATPIAWRIQGNKGGEDIADLVRGPMNNGGLYGEREGWYLPVAPNAKTAGWETAAPDAAPVKPGTYWLRAQVPLDLPHNHDVQLGLQFGDTELGRSDHRTRVLIFVNGWHIGNFIGHVGPQRVFILPPGILNPNGDNTLTLAVTTDGAPQNALEAVKLVNLHTARGGVPLQMVSQPAHVQR
ncbi:beta-galactosidase [Asticcacaulis sp. AC466]|uniref:beta-galactosidase n=1 Tax=Asticcacaulis sp. AC466 TaxID=1282362 RepID=UPI001F176B47|nr:beta-galactosidase [Asticcacaulis sp. AC466]